MTKPIATTIDFSNGSRHVHVIGGGALITSIGEQQARLVRAISEETAVLKHKFKSVEDSVNFMIICQDKSTMSAEALGTLVRIEKIHEYQKRADELEAYRVFLDKTAQYIISVEDMNKFGFV